MARLLATAIAIAIAIAIAAGAAVAQTCPMAPVAASALPDVLARAGVMRRSQPDAVAYTAKVDRDDDGAPNAYHRGLQDARPDPGLDHICVGGSVLEFANGRLLDRYGNGGSVGQLGGTDPKTGASRSQMCKRDYIAVRDAGFPACGPGVLCMIWYGVAAELRRCGFPSSFGSADDKRCGAPVRQLDAQGQPGDHYLTTTSLRRPQSAGNSRVQADYVDAAQVPYVVLPGGVKLPAATPWAVGDLALVVWKGRTVYAVVGDTGPAAKLGEASRAAVQALRGGGGTAAIPAEDPATTLVFPGTAATLQGRWPLAFDCSRHRSRRPQAGRTGRRRCGACRLPRAERPALSSLQPALQSAASGGRAVPRRGSGAPTRWRCEPRSMPTPC